MANSPSAASVMNEIINSMWDQEVGQIITGFEQKSAAYLDGVQNLEDILIDVNDAVKGAKRMRTRDMSSNMKDGLMDVCSRVALEPGFVMTPQLMEMAKESQLSQNNPPNVGSRMGATDYSGEHLRTLFRRTEEKFGVLKIEDVLHRIVSCSHSASNIRRACFGWAAILKCK
ncbi:hypothetical protein Ocin01_19390 [Orchesella cincta]|uniref:Uncharacterized protein n=1 Tax=Orchesella cincta TaxID=48709 RepID=A0A1D2M2Y2_ORCCI|nr:hypothetical protein Ocin01_19390 [Orchesella cincta]